MEHIECTACCTKTEARPPNRSFIALIAAFWVASFALGFGGAQGHGWTLVLGATWIALATSVFLLARRATSWTCADCGSAVAPPISAMAPPLTGAFRASHMRHA